MRVNLIVDSVYLDMYDDENISLTKRSKDLRNLNALFADYSNTFTLPASAVNNKIFKHYYNFNVIGGYDARIKVPAAVELDTITLQKGLLRLDKCIIKDGKVSEYKVTFYGNAVNLTDLFGKTTLDELNWDEYNHTRDAANVYLGLNAASSLFSNELIYPLITKDNQWTATTLSNSTVSPTELSPAVMVKKVIDKIASEYGLTFTSDFFNEAHFQKLYLWCPREIAAGDAAVIDTRGNPLPLENPGSGIYPEGVVNYDSGIYDIWRFYDQNFRDSLGSYVKVTPSTGDTYTLKAYGLLNGVWTLYTSSTTSGTQTIPVVFDELDGFTRLRFYIESVNPFTCDVETKILYNKPTLAINAYTSNVTGVQIDNFALQLKYRIPTMKVIDFLGGIMKMFNLIITPVSATEFDIEPYDVWKTEGQTRDFTSRMDKAMVSVSTPKLPKEIKYEYNDPKAINNNKYKQLFGDAYGDLSAKSEGGDPPHEVKVEFENLLWDRLPTYNLNVGFAFEKANDGFEDKAYLMYWGADTLTNPTIQLTGTTAIATYKMCHTYYPATTPTHSLNFGNEKNSYDTTEETVSLFSLYHQNYIETIFHEALRIHNIKMHLPAFIMAGGGEVGLDRPLALNDVIQIDDVYYNINSMRMNLVDGIVDFELINFTRQLSDITAPTDTDPPVIGELWIVGNPDTTAPVIGTLSENGITGDSIRIEWTAATDAVGVDTYEIYQDTVLVQTVIGSVLGFTVTSLANNTEYDFYIKAKDAAGNTSAASNTVTRTTLDVNAPVVTSPTLVWWYQPDSVTYSITATNSPDLYGATGLPLFLSLNTLSGDITGNITSGDVGIYSFNVRASNTAGASWGDYKEVIVEIF